MRKMKKINGYLVVRFNDREKRQDETLGSFGVIDAELYTGHLGIDRSAMDYDSADTIEEAVEQARGLNAEEDYTNEEPTVTVVRETADRTEEKTVDAQTMIAGWDSTLSEQIKSDDYPDVVPETARHELYGYKAALKELGAIADDECFVEPRHFEPEDVPSGEPGTFANLEPQKRSSGTARKVYSLGLALENDSKPQQNDCRLYQNIFGMCREIDEAINRVKGWPREVLEMELNRRYMELEHMYALNYSVRQYRRNAAEPGEKKEPPDERTAPQKMIIPQPNLSGADKAALKESVKRMLTEPGYGKGYTLKIDDGGQPTDARTAQCGKCPLQGKSEDLTALGKLLSEIEDYTKSDAPQTNADALEHHIRREKQMHNETHEMLNRLATPLK